MELGYQLFPSLRHLWMLSRLVPSQLDTHISPFIFFLKISKQLGGGVAESTDGFATTTAASLVRVKDDSDVVKWKTTTLTKPKAKKEEKGNDQNALKRPPITFFLLI
ncbi:hypothetical protein NC651_031156 [Populus alba x Populus x berolinensis]|nr:hypothetical protein NC651_031156 [Populus alba x Populus x berolinensis]